MKSVINNMYVFYHAPTEMQGKSSLSFELYSEENSSFVRFYRG